MKSKILIPLTVALLLNGCGKESPEEVTKSFVNAVNDADYEEAYKYVDDKGLMELDILSAYCKKDELKKYYKELKKSLFVLDFFPAELAKARNTYIKAINEKGLIRKEVGEDGYSLKKDIQTLKKMFPIAKKSFSPFFNKFKKKNPIYTLKNDTIVDMMIFHLVMHNGKAGANYPRELYYTIIYYLAINDKLSLNKQCVDKYTYLGNIDDVKYKFKNKDFNDAFIEAEVKTKKGNTKLEILKNKDKNIITNWNLRNEPILY